MLVSNPPIVSPNQLYLIAAARSVDANALATTSLSWQSTFAAASTLPMFVKVTRKTGTLSLLAATVTLNGTTIQTISAVQSALAGATASPLIYPTSSLAAVAVIPVAGNYQIVVGTINGSAATIDIEVYGIQV